MSGLAAILRRAKEQAAAQEACATATGANSGANTKSRSSRRTLRHVAIQGCCHGELDKIYAECRRHEQTTGRRIDLLLCCGDFQSVRNQADLRSMAVPERFRVMGDFHKYCTQLRGASDATSPLTGSITAPYLTLFIGGNHEASTCLFEQYLGGFVAPNVYYLGHSGVVTVAGLRIAGLSGIFKHRDLDLPYPVPPYAAYDAARGLPFTGHEDAIRSAYHVRKVEVERLHAFAAQEREETATAPSGPRQPTVDIAMSHDWPVGVTGYGDEAALLRVKPFFEEDLRHRRLGNPHTMDVLRALRPTYWLSAHLHCRFDADVPPNPSSAATGNIGKGTHFTALNKCVGDPRGFLDFIDIFVDEDDESPPPVPQPQGPSPAAAAAPPQPVTAAEAADGDDDDYDPTHEEKVPIKPLPAAVSVSMPVQWNTTKHVVRHDASWLRVLQRTLPSVALMWPDGSTSAAVAPTVAKIADAAAVAAKPATTTADLMADLFGCSWPPAPGTRWPVAPAVPMVAAHAPEAPVQAVPPLVVEAPTAASADGGFELTWEDG